jgi:alcohol dehydrogenase (cytochrome c)
LQIQTLTDRTKKLCPSHDGGSNFWSASYSPRTKLLYIPTRSTCDEIILTQDNRKNANGIINGAFRKYIARNETDIVVADPFTGEIKKKLHCQRRSKNASV